MVIYKIIKSINSLFIKFFIRNSLVCIRRMPYINCNFVLSLVIINILILGASILKIISVLYKKVKRIICMIFYVSCLSTSTTNEQIGINIFNLELPPLYFSVNSLSFANGGGVIYTI